MSHEPKNRVKIKQLTSLAQSGVLVQQPLIRAFLGDCMDLMKATADNHYDLAIVDPPYGIGNFRGGGDAGNKFNQTWNNNIPDLKYFTELRRVSKNQIIWGWNYYTQHLGSSESLVIWYKHLGAPNYSNGDIAITSFKHKIKIFDYPLMRGIKERGGFHPCEKPVTLYRWLLKNYAKAGQRILDTHGGSFSSAVACHMEGYEMDICEIDKEYFDAGVKRFKEATCQLKMF